MTVPGPRLLFGGMVTDNELRDTMRRLRDDVGALRFRKVYNEIIKDATRRKDIKKTLFPWRITLQAAVRQNWICPICGRPLPTDRHSIHGDHIDAVRRSGLNSVSNCQAVHAKCNLKKSDKTTIEVSKLSGRTILDQLTRKHHGVHRGTEAHVQGRDVGFTGKDGERQGIPAAPEQKRQEEKHNNSGVAETRPQARKADIGSSGQNTADDRPDGQAGMGSEAGQA